MSDELLMIWRKSYDAIEQAALTTPFDVKLEARLSDNSIPAMVTKLSVIASQIGSLPVDLTNVTTYQGRLIRSHAPIHMPLCRSMTFRVQERGNNASTRNFAAVLALLRGPRLERLELKIYSAYSDYIDTLIDVLEEEAFPAVRTISGEFTGGNWGSRRAVNAERKDALQCICASRGIDLTELKWT